MAVSPARRAAYEVLLRVFEQEAYADRVFRTAAGDLDERERAFAQRLAYGSVQRVRTLDHAIETLGKRPVRKLDPPVRASLRLGAYQLAYTDTAPHAAANESVELVRRARLERAVPFTNAVMRRLAQGIEPLLGSQEGERVLDLCAAPGGKASQLRGEVTAVEIDPNRASELRANLAALGAANVTVVEADGTDLPPELTGFDRALVDAPCSGLGVLAQRPDLRWRAAPLPELQLALLRSAAERVKPGGTLVYSVCTMNADENEAIVDASALEVVPLGEEWPQFAHPRRPEFLLTLPHVHGTSGFFVGRLRV